MLLNYHPAGQDEATVYEFKLEHLRSKEIEAIEKRTGGMAFGSEFREALLKGSALARRALLWTFERRQHPFRKFDDVDFADGEVVLELDAGELVEQREQVLKMAESGGLHPDDVEQALMMIDVSLAEWRRKHPDEDPEDAAGKAHTAS
ncbi:hypothetical protein [Actinoplanes sp. NPDC026623]|uniref:hypothetical protein n=1 Tax=Actinoplanes sp. NPDC026623 TaxID=3155610 RepID=UPI0033D6C771